MNDISMFFFIASIIFGGLGLIGLIIYLKLMAEQKRKDAWEMEARRLGFNFERQANHLRDHFRTFKIFNQGRNPIVWYVLYGTYQDTNAYIVDYEYTIRGTGRYGSDKTYRQTLFILQSPRLQLPHCFLRCESLFDHLESLFGGQDIDFDEAPAFSKAFVLQGANEWATRQVFTPMVRQAFLQLAAYDIQFECMMDTILVHNGTSTKPAQAEQHLAWAYGIKSIFG